MLKQRVELPPRLRLRLSAHGRLEITVGWETLNGCAHEALPLLTREYAEAKKDERLPYNPDWQRLLNWDATGSLRVWTVRAGSTLIGYASVLFMPHLYSSEVSMANVHAPYLMPEWREGWLGFDMLKALFEQLRRDGVQIVDMDIDADSRLNTLLDRMGFAKPEVRRRKWL